MHNIADSRWRVLPVGRAVTLQRTAVEALFYGLIGLLGLFGVAVISGILVEELFNETAAGTTIDLVGRACLAGVLVLGVIGLLLLGLLGALEGPLMARALSRAMQHGTPATEVPIPTQWEAAQESSARAYKGIAIALLAVLGLFYVIGVFAMLESLDAVGLAVIGGGTLLLAAIWAGIPLTGKVFTRWQRGFADELPERWTQPHRIIAAGRQLTEEDIAAARAAAGIFVPLPGRGVRALNSVLLSALVVAALAWLTAFQLVVAVAYPDATHTASRQLGDRAVLDSDGERLVDLLTLAEGISAAVGVLAFAAMVGCVIILRRLEHRELRRALGDPAAPPPQHTLLTRAMTRTSLPVLKVFFTLVGAAAALGFALWFVDRVAELPDWAFYAAAGPQLRAAAPLGPWIMVGALCAMGLGVVIGSLLDARDRTLRDELVQRWPVRPAKPDEPDEPDESDEVDGAEQSEGAGGDAPLGRSGNSAD